jgi:hypothetical protein
MFRKNQRHVQPALMSDLDHLTEKQRQRLDESWAGTFRHEVFARLDESPFAVLYSDTASRPNIPVNVLVGLETLKAGNGWSDEDLHDAFSFDVQVRYALGYENLGEGEFDLRTIYNFRQRVSEHMQARGENLIDRACTQVTDEPLTAFQLKTGQLRMDSSQIASNTQSGQACRVQLLVEVLQRLQRMLTPADQARYADAFAPYLKGHASHAERVYRLKGGQTAPHLQCIGELMHRLLAELRATYAEDASYQMLERIFGEQFRLSDGNVATIPGTEISASSLRSPDDLEATYRKKGNQSYQGYVTNVTETCAPENPFQLIVQVQTAPNTTEDAGLLIAAVPDLKARTGVETLYNDAAFCSPAADEVLRAHHIEQVPTDLRGKSPNPERLGLADFAIQCDADAVPAQITCPQQQSVPVNPGRKAHRYVARFDPAVCQVCALLARCPIRALASEPLHSLRFSQAQLDVARRRQRSVAYRQMDQNLRAAVEATIGALKRPFAEDQLPVRGRFRVGMMLVGSALMVAKRVRRIQRYLVQQAKSQKENVESPSQENGVGAALPSSVFALERYFQRLRQLVFDHPLVFRFSCQGFFSRVVERDEHQKMSG